MTAPDPGETGRYVPHVETHLVTSKCVRQQFKLWVMQPVQSRGETTPFPVVYATEANLTFDMLRGISYLLQKSGRDAPRFILVGIGYPGEGPEAGALLRARDMAFPGYPQFATIKPSIEGVLLPEGSSEPVGEATDFQRFLGEELFPFIDRKYLTIPDDRTFFGHSAAAGFGLYTLFKCRSLFNRFIISSPGLVFDGETNAGRRYENHEFMLDFVRGFLASKQTLPEITTYLSVGSDEEFEPGLESWRLTSSFYRLIALLRSARIPGLRVEADVLPGETHLTAWPIAFMHGVQAVFGTGRWRANSGAIPAETRS